MQDRAHVTLVVKLLSVADCDDLVLSSVTLDESREPLQREDRKGR